MSTLLKGRASFYPGVLDLDDAYLSFEASGRTYLTPEDWPLRPTLALRAGARKIWGDFPFFDAAIVGGSSTVRGYDSDRYAGDTAFFAGAELRLRLMEPRVLFFGEVGVLGFFDAGRVYLDGESPTGWHTGYGGGLWVSPVGISTIVSASIAWGEETSRVYIDFGFPF